MNFKLIERERKRVKAMRGGSKDKAPPLPLDAAGTVTIAPPEPFPVIGRVHPAHLSRPLFHAHLRDADASAEDLEQMLSTLAAESRAEVQGSLLFSCLGRGKHLYGRPDHDTDAFRRHLGEVPLGGFFCNGEIGPVGGTTFLHGYTSAIGLFRPAR